MGEETPPKGITMKVARLFIPLLLGAVVLLASFLPIQAQSTQRTLTLLTSESRTATTSSLDVSNIGENLNVKGAYLMLNVTGVQTTPLITLAVQAKNPATGDYVGIFTATAGVSSTATYLLYPGAGTAANDVTQTRSYPLPPVWRVRVTHDDTDPITYSVSAMLMQ